MINPMRAQPTRMMGLASGMDTDFIIQQTLRMHQFKIDNQMRNKKLIEWRQQTHTGIKDEISKLRSTYLSNLGSKTMMNRNVFNATKATITGANAGAVSIRTNTGSPIGNFKINSVTQLAKGAHMVTQGSVSADNAGFSSSAKLGDLDFANGGKIDWTRDGGTVKVGGKDVKIERADSGGAWTFAGADSAVWNGDNSKVTITVGETTRTLNLVTETVGTETSYSFTEDRPGIFAGTITATATTGSEENKEVPKEFKITVDLKVNSTDPEAEPSFTSNIGKVTIENGQVILRFDEGNEPQEYQLGAWNADTQTIGVTALEQQTQSVVRLEKEATLTVNDKAVQIRATDSLGDTINKINNTGGVSMSYDRLTDQFTLQARLGNYDPASTTLTLDGGGSNFFDLISGTGEAPEIVAGQKAIVRLNDEDTDREFNTNSFEFRGVNITINDTFSGEAVSVNLARDSEPALNAIKGFIDSYNAIIARLEGLLSERKGANEAGYKPLTDEEKAGMTDKQIEEWEAIAKKGILRNDNGIQNLVNNLRRSFFESIEGMGVSASQIGLTTGAYRDGTGGQIIINEEKLKEALEKDPEMVADIFVKIDTSSGSPRGVGLLHKLDGLMRDYVNESQPISIRSLEDSLKRVNEQIQRMQERMFAEEDKLYRQFAAMETAMQKLQQQGGWFNAMLGS